MGNWSPKYKEERLEQKKAFEYYYQSGDARSYTKVSEAFGVSHLTVAKWGKAFNWQGRVEQRDIEIGQKLKEQTSAIVLNTKATYRQIIKTAVDQFLGKLEKGLIDIDSINDIEKLIKLDLLLMGEKTENVICETLHKIEEYADVYNKLAHRGRSVLQSGDAGDYTGEPVG